MISSQDVAFWGLVAPVIHSISSTRQFNTISDFTASLDATHAGRRKDAGLPGKPGCAAGGFACVYPGRIAPYFCVVSKLNRSWAREEK
jgi:hypothetical protein